MSSFISSFRYEVFYEVFIYTVVIPVASVTITTVTQCVFSKPLLYKEMNCDGVCLLENPNPDCLLKWNPEKINWDWSLEKPNAASLLKPNPEIINWDWDPKISTLLKHDP